MIFLLGLSPSSRSFLFPSLPIVVETRAMRWRWEEHRGALGEVVVWNSQTNETGYVRRIVKLGRSKRIIQGSSSSSSTEGDQGFTLWCLALEAEL